MILRLLILSVVLAVSSCAMWGDGVPDPVAVEPGDTHLCDEACGRLRALGCPEGEPLDDGTSCEDFCARTQRAGHALDLRCVVDLSVCEELDAMCGRAGP